LQDQLTLEGVHETPWPIPEVIRTKGGWTVELRSVLVQDDEALLAMRDTLLPLRDVVYDSETSGLKPNLGHRICGHCFAAVTEPQVVTAYYVPVRHIGGHNEAQPQIDPTRAADVVRQILNAPGRCGLHHAKFDQGMLRADGVEITRQIEDTSIDATIANENERSFALKRLADLYCISGAAKEEKDLQAWMRADARKLGIPYRKRRRGEDLELLEEETYLERFGYARTPITLCGAYGCRDVFYTLYLWLVKYADVQKMYPDLHAREHRVSKILHKMEWHGLDADGPLIRDAHDRSGAEVRHWLGECRRLTGDSMFQSTDNELRKLFYEQLGMNVLRMTKGGRTREKSQPSVDKIARKLLVKKYPQHKEVIEATMKLARARKLHGTYSGSFLKFLSDKGRIHPSYNQLEQRDEGGVPVTGRLSSADPNIQNIDSKPLHLLQCGCDECVKDYQHAPGPLSAIHVHKYFVVPEGYIRFYIDFSQIELRVLTWLCQDPVLLDCYRRGLDVHQIIADQLDIERKIAKQVNFGNSYGMTKIGLALRLPGYFDDPEGTEAFAERVLQAYFRKYARILHFRAMLADHMRKNGCMFMSPFNRPRRIPSIRSPRRWERERAERMMMSSIVSGTAADIMKESMIRCDDILETSAIPADQVQSIHDELVFDVRMQPGWASLLIELVRAMEDWPQFSHPEDRVGVPIKVSAEVTTTTWADKRAVEVLDNDQLRWAA
jgi:DNA polymerase I-like protein with 3'-5' exonuclease and polymerase domains